MGVERQGRWGGRWRGVYGGQCRVGTRCGITQWRWFSGAKCRHKQWAVHQQRERATGDGRLGLGTQFRARQSALIQCLSLERTCMY